MRISLGSDGLAVSCFAGISAGLWSAKAACRPRSVDGLLAREQPHAAGYTVHLPVVAEFGTVHFAEMGIVHSVEVGTVRSAVLEDTVLVSPIRRVASAKGHLNSCQHHERTGRTDEIQVHDGWDERLYDCLWSVSLLVRRRLRSKRRWDEISYGRSDSHEWGRADNSDRSYLRKAPLPVFM